MCAALLFVAFVLPAADRRAGANYFQEDFPFQGACITARGPGNNVAMKGFAIRVGNDANMLWDTDLLRCAAGWTGGYITGKGVVYDGGHGQHPAIVGEQKFGTREAGHTAELEVVFEKTRVVVRGPLGAWWQPYDPGYLINFNRPQLTPWWGAWRWAILALIAIATVASLFAMWWSLALLYLPLVKVIAFFADRAVTWGGAWRLAAAGLLPGACLMAAGLVLHGFGAVDLIRFALLYVLHVVLGFIFVITSPFFLPKLLPAVKTKNPFTGSGEL